MTTDIELLPLPQWTQYNAHLRIRANSLQRRVQDYARANMAPLIAEIERLRAEREVIGAEAVKYAGKSGRLEAKVERLAEALRAVVADMREWGEPAKGAHVERIQRRLDDALRDHDQEAHND